MAITLAWNDEQEAVSIEAKHVQLLEQLLHEVAASEQVVDGEVSLSFVDDEVIRELNRDYRGINQATDVLSFPLADEQDDLAPIFALDADEDQLEETEIGEAPPTLLGDIIISIPTALRQSEEYGHSFERELGFLFVHGFLHLLGYDHESEETEQVMIAKQEAALTKVGLAR